MTKRPDSQGRDIDPYEQQLRGWLEYVQPPLYAALEQEYRVDRGWLVCGPATIVLSRLMQEWIRVPIKLGGQDEHIELTVGFFDPSGGEYQPSDHTHLRYYTGRGDVFFIDMIYNRLWPAINASQEATIVERFTVHEIDLKLQHQFSLYPFEYFETVWPRLGPFDPWALNDFSERSLDDFAHALNQQDVTSNQLVGRSGKRYDISLFWGERVQRVIDNTRLAL